MNTPKKKNISKMMYKKVERKEEILIPKKKFERKEIKKEGIEKLGPNEKQIWMMVLSWMHFEELFVISQVCKNFFFILKEEQKFWKLFLENHQIQQNGEQLKSEISWKNYALTLFQCRWDESRFYRNYKLDPNDNKIVISQYPSIWQTAITKNHFIEEILYAFEMKKIPL